ncbi:MerR family transcriptional regulator [Rhodococcus sp. 06-235-1A]|uniref:MerR family transcriptional regulator n=1 Tax=Rhodococcus sp. 06-235-1A TaxID=2022508 RepID=UPI000B9BA781|nr:MerR family transcriptional regulator [Rhodococcus sp. 06-235-1A]OZD08171.1 MerR family transcriptional regulator [Rhodococcus sp. 06-235-1A]
MRIGELAVRTGVSVRSLRYYEQQGLLASNRTSSGQRVYSEWAVDRVVHIQELFAAGIASKTVSALLPCMRDVDGGPAATATDKLAEMLAAERARIDEAIRSLEVSRGVLDDVIDSARPDARPGHSRHPQV